ncbi:serine/threonine-protein phosphatase 6 regulatory ankyrin repeat subunit C [Aplysia californica]|uniref:Serine/threonine-protein phosphatase 6 regulatory ankyrin repeat subunit C n=1 Tax=Aplysia californica TaxID=6500 RepID=A0ABM0JKL1_APLCA|nr:serine/threonine-protein phosphatase 6 regulatory ankyrin repeat subunit C [Aplysia californica]
MAFSNSIPLPRTAQNLVFNNPLMDPIMKNAYFSSRIQLQPFDCTKYLDAIKNSKFNQMGRDSSCSQMAVDTLNSLVSENGFATPLLTLVALEQTEIVEILIMQGASCNIQNILGHSPLHLACLSKAKKMTELLLSEKWKSDVNLSDCFGYSALFYAIFGGDVDIISFLLSHKAEVNIQSFSGLSPLIAASAFGLVGVVNDLLDKGANVNCQNTEGMSPLMGAVCRDSQEIVECLLEHGAKVDLVDRFGETAFTLSVLMGHYDCMKMLLKYGADINHTNIEGISALMLAVFKSDYKMTNCLLKKEAGVDVCDKNGRTALFYAVESGFYAGVQNLLKAKANASAFDYKGISALAIACSKKPSHLPKLLATESNYNTQMCVELNISLENCLVHQQLKTFDCLLDKHKLCKSFRNQDGETLLHRAVQFLSDKKMLQKVVKVCSDSVNSKSLNGLTPLLKSVMAKNTVAVKVLVNSGVDVNCQDINGVSPLHCAAELGLVTIMNSLLHSKADINCLDCFRQSALMKVCSVGCIDGVKLLIANKCNVNLTEHRGWNALMFAAQKGFVEVITLLLENKMDVGKKSASGVTALAISAGNGHKRASLTLLEHGAQVNEGFVKSWMSDSSPLYFALLNKHPSVVRELVARDAHIGGVTINKSTATSSTASLLCVQSRNLGLVTYFVQDCKVDVNKGNLEGLRPIHVAAFNGDVDILGVLLKAGADPNVATKSHVTALINASVCGSLEITRLLIEKGARVDERAEDGWTPLMFFAQTGNSKCMEMILAKSKADIDSEEEKGNTALHIAVSNGKVDAVKMLLDKKANPDKRNAEGLGPVLICAHNGQLEILQCLLESSKCDLEVKTSRGETALLLAAKTGRESIVKLLLKKGALVNAVSDDRETALHVSVSGGYYGIAEELIKNGVDKEKIDLKGNTALLNCAGRLPILKILVERGADLNKLNNKNMSVLHLSFQCKNKECAKFLLRQKSLSRSTRENAKVYASCELYMNDFIQLIENTEPDLESSQQQEQSLLPGDIGESEEPCAAEEITEKAKKAAIVISKSLKNIPEVAALKNDAQIVVNINNMYVNEKVENMALQNSQIIHNVYSDGTDAAYDSETDDESSRPA